MENKTEEKELSRDMQSFSQLEQLGEEFRDVAQRLEENVQQIYREIPETDDLDSLEKLAGELKDMGVRIGKAGVRLLSVADELAAGAGTCATSAKSGVSSPPLPPTAPSTWRKWQGIILPEAWDFTSCCWCASSEASPVWWWSWAGA